jgi:exodeoxyribonuclease VII large subunit
VFASSVPVISAVGHETDHTVCDLVADLRAPTPSAAAEIAVPDRMELAARLVTSRQALDGIVTDSITGAKGSVERLWLRMERSRPQLDTLRMRVDDLLHSAASHMSARLQVTRERLEGTSSRLEALSPVDTLRRGYAIVQHKDTGAVVTDVAQTAPGDELHVTVSTGEFPATVANESPDASDDSR